MFQPKPIPNHHHGLSHPPANRYRSATKGLGRPRRNLAVLLVITLEMGLAAAVPMDEGTQPLLVEAVEAAAELDLYGARCRGDASGRNTDNLNKLMVGKLRTTVLSVQDDLFPEHSYRGAQRRLEADFLSRLRELGGCQAAKDAGLPAELNDRYREKLKAIQALP